MKRNAISLFFRLLNNLFGGIRGNYRRCCCTVVEYSRTIGSGMTLMGWSATPTFSPLCPSAAMSVSFYHVRPTSHQVLQHALTLGLDYVTEL